MKVIRAILIGIGIWGLAVTCYTLSYQFPILEDPDQQANMVLFSIVMPIVWLGSYLYYKKGNSTHGFKVGEVFLVVAAFLDAVITVPLFVIPNGGNHYTFFTDPGFWIIALEMVGTATLYYYIRIYPKSKSINA
jgi:type IV secretory pathway VirB3-like protein